MKRIHLIGLASAFALAMGVVVSPAIQQIALQTANTLTPAATAKEQPKAQLAANDDSKLETAVFASGCYWCTESDFDKVKGVKHTISGFTGGHVKNPTYGLVGQGRTGHTEALLIQYDPAVVSYNELLDYYWRHVDFFDANGQFCDRGSQYRPEIFVSNSEQRGLAEKSKQALAAKFKRKIAVEITDASTFYPAKEAHQNYHKKHPVSYKTYRWGCGRDKRIKEIWSGVKSTSKPNPRNRGSY